MLLQASADDDCYAAGGAENHAGEDRQKRNYLIVGQDGEGRWIARDRLGLKAGIFSSFASALHFAKDEAEAAHAAVILSSAPIELGVQL